MRKPREYLAKEPGDIVEMDTLDVRPLPGLMVKHFTARDTVSRWDVIQAFSQATAASATRFVNAVVARMLFPVRAIQIDGGSEFQSVFEEECRRLDIRLFVLPARSPKLNGHVERAHRTHTHTEEFYEVTDTDFDIQMTCPPKTDPVLMLDWQNRKGGQSNGQERVQTGANHRQTA